MSAKFIHISLASQLAEAQRILQGTEEKLRLVRLGGREPSADQVLKLHAREAIVATLKQLIVGESPLN